MTSSRAEDLGTVKGEINLGLIEDGKVDADADAEPRRGNKDNADMVSVEWVGWLQRS